VVTGGWGVEGFPLTASTTCLFRGDNAAKIFRHEVTPPGRDLPAPLPCRQRR
jgi:hypothetical protein